MVVATFPIKIDFPGGGWIFIPNLGKLQEHWKLTNANDQNLIRKHFVALGVDVDRLIQEPETYEIIGEIPTQPTPPTQVNKPNKMRGYYHEFAERQHRIQRDLK